MFRLWMLIWSKTLGPNIEIVDDEAAKDSNGSFCVHDFATNTWPALNLLRTMTVFPRNLRKPCRHLLYSALGILLSLFQCDPNLSAQQETPVGSVAVKRLTMGYTGVGRVGNWLPVRVAAQGLAPSTEVSLVISASDPRGDQCESVVASGTSDSEGSLSLEGVFMTGRQDGIIRLRLDDASGKLLWQHSVTCRAPNAKAITESEAIEIQSAKVVSRMTLLRHQSLTLLTVGVPAGLDELYSQLSSGDASREPLTLLTVDSIEDLPASRRDLDSVDIVLLVTAYNLSEIQTQAIRDWVMTGGQLIVSCGVNLPQLLASPVGLWLQPEFGIQNELLQSQDLTALQNYVAGASQLQTNRQNVPVVRMASLQPRTVVNSINGPLISRISEGAGVVTMVAVDLNQKPLNRWLSLSQFYEILLFDRLRDSAAEQASRSGRISSSGVTDLSTQLANVSDAIPANERWSSWHAMLLMVVYLVIIGPLDYLLVARLLRRPKLTWITFPLLVAAACGLTVLWAGSDRAAATVREVHLLDVGQQGSRQLIHSRSWSSLSTSDSRYASVAARALPVMNGQPLKAAEQTLMWHGRAEDVYGGLYRPGGAGLGQQTSRRTEIGDAQFTSVPLMVDGSQAFVAESFYESTPTPAFESNLKMPGSGLLNGTFVHHLPVAINDWVILFGNRVYLPSQKADEKFRRIEPNEPWSRESGGVRVSEIRDFLRGVRLVSRERKKGDTTSSASTQIQSFYNTSGTNPLDILLMVSLYNTAGGDVFVRLQDNYLRRDEVSDAIQLNTAMLIGTIDLPLTQLQLDSQRIEPARTQTVVRFFLPVYRSSASEIPKEADPKADTP